MVEQAGAAGWKQRVTAVFIGFNVLASVAVGVTVLATDPAAASSWGFLVGSVPWLLLGLWLWRGGSVPWIVTLASLLSAVPAALTDLVTPGPQPSITALIIALPGVLVLLADRRWAWPSYAVAVLLAEAPLLLDIGTIDDVPDVVLLPLIALVPVGVGWYAERARVRYESDLELALARASAGDRAKSDLLAVVGHELLTPLNAVLGAKQLLDHDDLHPSDRGLLELIETGARDLETSLRGLLELVDQRTVGEVQLAEVELASLLQAVVEANRAQAEQAGTTLHTRVEAGAPPVVTTDGDRVGRALRHLLDNALRFAAGGRVELVLRRVGPGVVLEVIDDGPGITPDRLEQLQEPLVQADMSSTRRHGGLGIGLAQTRLIMTELGGRLTLAPASPRGTRASLALPEHPSHALTAP